MSEESRKFLRTRSDSHCEAYGGEIEQIGKITGRGIAKAMAEERFG